MLIIADHEEAAVLESFVSSETGGQIFSYTDVESCSAAWKLISCNPYRFSLVFMGSSVADRAGKEDVRYINMMFSYNPRILLAMCTAQMYLPFEIFSMPCFHTMKAPCTRTDICEMLSRAATLEKIRNGHPASLIAADSGMGISMIPAGSVIYARKVRNGIALITECGEIFSRRKMDDFQRFAGNSFLRCHGSFIVNMNHVTDIIGDEIRLDNGEGIPISRGYQQAVHRYLEFYSLIVNIGIKE